MIYRFRRMIDRNHANDLSSTQPLQGVSENPTGDGYNEL